MRRILTILLFTLFAMPVMNFTLSDLKDVKGKVNPVAKAEEAPEPVPTPAPPEVLD